MTAKDLILFAAIIGIMVSCSDSESQNRDFKDNATYISSEYILPLLNDEINTLFISISNCNAEHGRYEEELTTAKKIVQNYEPFKESSVTDLAEFAKIDEEINNTVRSYLEETSKIEQDSAHFQSKIVYIRTTEALYSQLASEMLAVKVRNALFLLSNYTCTSELDMDKKNYPIESIRN